MFRTTSSWLLAALLSICGSACSRSQPSKQLSPEFSALDKAYNSGVLTRDEYEAKKAALENEAAAIETLDKSVAAGALSKDEYQARRARLSAKRGSLMALEKALRAGALTQDEYLTKRTALIAPETLVLAASVTHGEPLTATSAPLPDAVPPQHLETAPDTAPAQVSSPSAASIGQEHAYRMKMVKILDEHGFERPMTSVSMLVPLDWQSQGETSWNVKDNCNTIRTSIRVSGPDGRAFEVFPAYNWVWADDPQYLKMAYAQAAQSGGHPCEVISPMSAADYLRRNISRLRPNARVVAMEPAPKLMQILQAQARQTEQSAAQYRLQQRVRPDVVRARVKYEFNGRPMEEWIIAATTITGTLGPSYNAATGQMTQSYTYSCVANVVAERAPQGQLDASEKFFELINSTVRVNPEWQSRVNGNAAAIQQIQLKGVRDRSAIVTKNAEEIRNIQRQGYENQQKSEDHVFGQYSQSQRGVETYRNPSTGETIDLSSQYGHAWVNNRGEYLLSDQAGFDPSVTLKEEWKPLEHVKP